VCHIVKSTFGDDAGARQRRLLQDLPRTIYDVLTPAAWNAASNASNA